MRTITEELRGINGIQVEELGNTPEGFATKVMFGDELFYTLIAEGNGNRRMVCIKDRRGVVRCAYLNGTAGQLCDALNDLKSHNA